MVRQYWLGSGHASWGGLHKRSLMCAGGSSAAAGYIVAGRLSLPALLLHARHAAVVWWQAELVKRQVCV